MTKSETRTTFILLWTPTLVKFDLDFPDKLNKWISEWIFRMDLTNNETLRQGALQTDDTEDNTIRSTQDLPRANYYRQLEYSRSVFCNH